MKDKTHGSGGPLRKREATTPAQPLQEEGQLYENSQPEFTTNGHALAPRISLWVLLDLLLSRWHWLVLGCVFSGALFYLLGLYVVKPKFTATAQLLRYESPGKSEYFKTAPVSGDTFAAMLRAPELLRAVGDQLRPPVPPERLTKWIKVDASPDSDMVNLQMAARTPEYAVDVLNRFSRASVDYLRQLEARQDAQLAQDYLKKEVGSMDQDIKDLQEQFRKLPLGGQWSTNLALVGGQLSQLSTNLTGVGAPSMLGFAKQAERLQTAMAELNDLLLKYTEKHPAVLAKESQIEAIRSQMAAASTNRNATALAFVPPLTGAGTGGDPLNPEAEIIHIKLRALEDARVDLSKRQREAELYAANPPGSVRLFAPADIKTVKTNLRWVKISAVGVFGALLGLGGSLVLVLLVEFVDRRLKTADDLERVTELPVFASLGNLRAMSPQARSQWAFRTWTMLQGRLSPSPNYGLVCGVTSSKAGEGRSTWISLLAEAASLTGFRVLTVATRPSPTHVEANGENGEESFAEDGDMNDLTDSSQALTTSVLASPAKVTEQLTGPNCQPVVHIPLPGWVWNLERRKQWGDALEHWRQIDNLVILVELPPANVPEAVLLGSSLPNLLWLASSGEPDAAETRAELRTLRDARCHVVGAVLNREPSLPVRKRFPRWMTCLTLLLAVSAGSAHAQTTNSGPTAQTGSCRYPVAALLPPAAQDGIVPPGSLVRDSNAATLPKPDPLDATPDSTAAKTPLATTNGPSTNGGFSLINPDQRAAWQRNMTLGPGDVLNFGLYGEPELRRVEVAVAPDGRVNFLEAQEVLATGLTIDELRAKIDQELSQYRRAPRTIITPVAFKSKKYFMLGRVVGKGVYTLDRPITVLEALANAHGFENALVDRNIVDLVDFQRSFLARRGKRYPLNFERLFQQGDLAQNIAVEPGDYIYFAPGDVPQIYVVGEVRFPGPVSYTPDLTVVNAITIRSGYTERAFKARVLVVRGPLDHPETFIVNTHTVLTGKEPDFKLRPKDIIYVNSRPFILVEEAADLAATAFIQSAISTWVGVDVIQPFNF